MTITIRPLNNDDRAQWEPLWKGYQEFYETNLDHVTDDLWQRLMSDLPDGPVCLVAEENDELLGIVQYLFHGTTWSPKRRIYLNDLFTTKKARGKGVGRMLIEAVYEVCDREDCETVYWMTQEFNYAGRMLYDKVANRTPFIKYSR